MEQKGAMRHSFFYQESSDSVDFRFPDTPTISFIFLKISVPLINICPK